MAERPLRDVLVDEPPRRGVPVWIWGCGGGCLLVVLLFIGLTVFMFDRVQKATGPDAAWPALGDLVTVPEPPPAGLTALLIDPRALAREFGGIFGASDEQLAGFGFGRSILVVSETDARTALFAVHHADDAAFDGIPAGAETLEFELQGRTVAARRFTPVQRQEDLRLAGLAIDQPALAIDLGVRGDERLVVHLQSRDHGITVDEAREFLAPFDLWAKAAELASPPAPSGDPAPDGGGDGR